MQSEQIDRGEERKWVKEKEKECWFYIDDYIDVTLDIMVSNIKIKDAAL